MSERFNEIAGDYDHWLDIDPDYPALHDSVIGILREEIERIKDGCGWMIPILEIGCGTGYTSRRILDVNRHVKLRAIDKSYEMVEESLRKLNYSERDRCFVFEADVLDYVDRPYPVVISVFMLHNLQPEERKKAIRNMAAVLRPGALLILGDKIAPDSDEEYQESHTKFWEIIESLKSLGPEGRYDYWCQHEREDERIKMTESELTMNLKEAGLQEVFVGLRCGIGMYAVATARKPV